MSTPLRLVAAICPQQVKNTVTLVTSNGVTMTKDATAFLTVDACAGKPQINFSPNSPARTISYDWTVTKTVTAALSVRPATWDYFWGCVWWWWGGGRQARPQLLPVCWTVACAVIHACISARAHKSVSCCPGHHGPADQISTFSQVPRTD